MSISLFRTATKFLLAFISRAAWQHRYYSTKVVHSRKDVLEGHAPFYLINFFCTINFTVSVYLYLYLQPREKRVFFRRWFSEMKTDLVFSFLSCLVKFPSSETQGQIVGARESLNGRKNMARRKVKNGEKSPWEQCLTRPVPNGRRCFYF